MKTREVDAEKQTITYARHVTWDDSHTRDKFIQGSSPPAWEQMKFPIKG